MRPGGVENCRGLGVADLAEAIRNGESHRAKGELAYHVLDMMHSILQSASKGQHVTLHSTCHPPPSLPSAVRKNGSR